MKFKATAVSVKLTMTLPLAQNATLSTAQRETTKTYSTMSIFVLMDAFTSHHLMAKMTHGVLLTIPLSMKASKTATLMNTTCKTVLKLCLNTAWALAVVNRLSRTELLKSTALRLQRAHKPLTQMALFMKPVTTLHARTSSTQTVRLKISAAQILVNPTWTQLPELSMRTAQIPAALRQLMSIIQLILNAHGLHTPSASPILTCASLATLTSLPFATTSTLSLPSTSMVPTSLKSAKSILMMPALSTLIFAQRMVLSAPMFVACTQKSVI